MRIAIIGGSFNPIHMGHLALADDVSRTFNYQKILFVVANNPPHKEMKDNVPAIDRLNMVRAACSLDDRFEAESCEIDRGGVSYTYDTVCYLCNKYKYILTGKIGLVIGADLIADFHLWNKAKELAEMCDLILARRPFIPEKKEYSNKSIGDYGKSIQITDNLFNNEVITKDPLFANAKVIENPLISISSTDIRTRIIERKSFQYLVPSSVFKYIINGRIYGHK